MERLTIQQASARLDVSEQTIRRRLDSGDLSGEKDPGHNGRRWVLLEDAPLTPQGRNSGGHVEVRRLEEMVGSLKEELVFRRREVEQLHVLLQMRQPFQQKALTQLERPWWRRLLATLRLVT